MNKEQMDMEMEQMRKRRKLFDQSEDDKCKDVITVFVYKGVTYCFFALSEQPLPKSVLAYDERTKKAQLCAKAIFEYRIKEGKDFTARSIVRDYRCAQFIELAVQTVKQSDILYHIFLMI